MQRLTGSGGTSGGVGQFALGFVLAGFGLYLFFSRIVVMSSFWTLFGRSGFGVVLLAFLVGVGALFANARSTFGKFLVAGSLLAMVVGVLLNLTLFFRPTNLITTLWMLALLGGGIGLMVRSFRASN